MSFFRILGVVLFVIGVVLLVLGITSTQKMGEKVVEEVTGHYIDSTVWYIIGGFVLVIGGLGMTRMKR